MPQGKIKRLVSDRGFGFVEMAEDKEAKEAIQGLNNKEIEGRAISVSVAKEKKADNKRW